jgi:hypothetical protein
MAISVTHLLLAFKPPYHAPEAAEPPRAIDENKLRECFWVVLACEKRRKTVGVISHS